MKGKNIFGLFLLICLTACQDDFFDKYSSGNGNGQLMLTVGMGEDFVSTRSVEKPVFQEGTLFHLYGTVTNAESKSDVWTTNYLNKKNEADNATERWVVAKAMSTKEVGEARVLASDDKQKADGYELAETFLTQPLNLYGVTVVGMMADETAETDEEIIQNNALLDHANVLSYDETSKVPQYQVTYQQVTSEGSGIKLALRDIMWSDSLKGLTPVTNAGKVVMPFVHTLSKLNFYAEIADDIENESETTPKIVIKSFTLKDYSGGTLSVANGLYTRTDNLGRTNVVAPYHFKNTISTIDAEGKTTESAKVLDTSPWRFASTLIFPTTGSTYAVKTTEEEVLDLDAVEVTLVVNIDDSEEDKEFIVKLTDVKNDFSGVWNEEFQPNREYDITFTLTTNSVLVTLSPEYYEYINDPISLDEYQFGEPIDFGGVLWATQNLGATSANPLHSPKAWEEARGFYYQYGRNIPFYVRHSSLDPHSDVSVYGTIQKNDNTTFTYNQSDPKSYWDGEYPWFLDENKTYAVPYGATRDGYKFENTHGARAYPYIPILWEEEIKKAPGDTEEKKIENGYKNFLEKYRFYSDYTGFNNGQHAPDKNYSDPYQAKYVLENVSSFSSPTTADRKLMASMAYSSYHPGNFQYTRYWDQRKNLPNNWASSNGKNPNDPSPKGWRLPTEAEFLSIIPGTMNAGNISFSRPVPNNQSEGVEVGERSFTVTVPDDYGHQEAVYVGIYQDGQGYNDLLVNDKRIDYPYDNDTGSGNKYPTEEGWGTVYAIKKIGKTDAYAIRWQIKIVDYDEINGQRLSGINPALNFILEGENVYAETPKIGRGCLVISKYDLGRDSEKMRLRIKDLYTTDEDGKEIPVPDGYRDGKSPAQSECVVYLDNDGDETYDPNKVGSEIKDRDLTKLEFDWDSPSGVLYLPIPGYVIVPSTGGQALIYPGVEGLYWTSSYSYDSTYGYFGKAVRIKYAGDYLSRFIYVSQKEHIAKGCNIRCVRDIKAPYR